MEWLRKGIPVLITISMPILISVLAILVLVSPLYINLEYRRPGFPEDSYGFTTAERLAFGNQTRRYLISSDTLDDLRELRFENGEPIYKESELTHLEDVKVLLRGVLWVFYGAAAIFAFGNTAFRRRGVEEDFVSAVALGGKLTAILLIVILILTVISFQALFTNFHRLFFEGDSWLFYYSDTLIRLFPVQFWQDVFIAFGLMTLAGGVLAGWVLPARRKKSLAKEDQKSGK